MFVHVRVTNRRATYNTYSAYHTYVQTLTFNVIRENLTKGKHTILILRYVN